MGAAEQLSVDLEKLVAENEKLVHFVANRFVNFAKTLQIDYEDLVSEGTIGLITAINKFDPSYGYKFSTYAVPMIEGQIKRLMRDTNPGAKFPRSVKDLASKITGEESVEELIEKHGVLKWIAEGALLFKTNRKATSLDQTFANNSDDKDMTIGETIPATEDYSEIYIDDFLSSLDDDRLKIIVNGLMAHKTQGEIAKEVGCSQVQVSRLLRKIREKYLAYEREDADMTKRADITKEGYEALKEKGFTDRQIAEKFSVSTATLFNHKRKWKEVISPKAKSDSEYQQLMSELSDALEAERKSGKEKDTLIEKLEAKVKVLENLQAASKDVESEVNDLKTERDNYRDQLLETRHVLTQKDYECENMKRNIENMDKAFQRYEKENRALRELLSLWI